jgi:hypothetical protein
MPGKAKKVSLIVLPQSVKKNLGCGLAGKCVYSKAIAKYHVLWFKCVG